MPVGAQTESLHHHTDVSCLDRFVKTYDGRNELHADVAVFRKLTSAHQAIRLAVLADIISHALRQQNPCSELMQEVGADLSYGLSLAHIKDKVGILAFPSHPTLHVGGASVESVGKSLVCDGLVFLLRRNVPRYLCASRLVLHVARQESLTIESAVVVHIIVTFVQRRHAVHGTSLLERIERILHFSLVAPVLRTCNLQLAVSERQSC